MILGLHHVAVSCADIDRSLAFYRDILGLEILVDYGEAEPYEDKDRLLAMKGARSRAVLLGNDLYRIELIQFKHPVDDSGLSPALNRIGFSHIALGVENIQQEYRRLVDQGVAFNSEPICFGAVTAAYARDPDGNVIELLETNN